MFVDDEAEDVKLGEGASPSEMPLLSGWFSITDSRVCPEYKGRVYARCLWAPMSSVSASELDLTLGEV